MRNISHRVQLNLVRGLGVMASYFDLYGGNFYGSSCLCKESNRFLWATLLVHKFSNSLALPEGSECKDGVVRFEKKML